MQVERKIISYADMVKIDNGREAQERVKRKAVKIRVKKEIEKREEVSLEIIMRNWI